MPSESDEKFDIVPLHSVCAVPVVSSICRVSAWASADWSPVPVRVTRGAVVTLHGDGQTPFAVPPGIRPAALMTAVPSLELVRVMAPVEKRLPGFAEDPDEAGAGST